MSSNDHTILLERKRHLTGLLEIACQQLEITLTQRQQAETAYQSVTEFLAECPTLGRFEPLISPQGSAALETTNKPINSERFDVDVLGHLRLASDRIPHDVVKGAFGRRLKEYEKQFGPVCSEYKRCWRLDYAEGSKMHLDITPAVNHTTSPFGSLAVPDRVSQRWEESNPPGYIESFRRIAELRPNLSSQLIEFSEKAASAEIEPLPAQTHLKGFLRRTVQLVKRHRSLHFEKNPELAPISVILTTLAMRAYERIIREGRFYESEFDVVSDIISLMPEMVELDDWGQWRVMNHTTQGENFAEKWNRPDSLLANAFFAWHQKAAADFADLARADRFEAAAILDRIVGAPTGSAVREKEASLMTEARSRGGLAIASSGVITSGPGIRIPGNTFFGA
jgi:hypothetical protein